MVMDREKEGAVAGRIVKERRSRIDRRVLTYDYYIPERRIPWDRRQGNQWQAEWRNRRKSA
jgi:hypothetical protein